MSSNYRHYSKDAELKDQQPSHARSPARILTHTDSYLLAMKPNSALSSPTVHYLKKKFNYCIIAMAE